MNQIKLRKGTFQHVESELYAYHDTCKEIVRLKNEILYGKKFDDENVGGGRSNIPGDPTGSVAIKLVTHKKLEQLLNITDAIETVLNQLPEEKKELVRIRYWTRPQTLTWDGIASKLHVSRRTAINWRDEIVRDISVRIGWR